MKDCIGKFAVVAFLSCAIAACNGGLEAASGPEATKIAPISMVSLPIDTDLDQSTLALINDLSPPQTANRYDSTTVSLDGTVISFTVYAPNIAVGNSAPLLLHGHGWGDKRAKNLDSTTYEAAPDVTLQGAKLALDSGMQGGKGPTRGWYVISFDQRGFGESGGLANLMDPQLEGQDIKAIIDWAQSHLPRLAYRKNSAGLSDPVIGAVGASYGGGFQTIGSGVDRRIDAIVPAATWHDLRYSLFNHPKSEYLTLLTGLGLKGGRVAPFYYQAVVDASTKNQVSSDFSRRMYLHSPVSYCDGNSPDMQAPGIPAFVTQASTDILL
ncbi:CocE/NonD family hydrolase [Herbaspirillum sp. GCM10030257]|uniref:CocE/NonD family hydrolase n=1 Tax=Herbaspirillum sp. GCM10030257 TaxID=3273393 RepID=UPI00360A2F1E